jgi:chloramphenicol-sensitive protein RarD
MTALIAYAMWGVFPVYFKLVQLVPPTEVLVHRIVWAVPFGALILYFRKQWPEVRAAFSAPSTLFWLAVAALFISLNWFIYIWAVQQEEVLQASLGYYINPLMYVLVGVLFLKERLRRAQVVSVVLAAIGVSYLTIKGGQFPFVAISLALLFTLYGVIRKQVAIGAMPGLFIETLLLFFFALAWLGWLMVTQQAEFGHGGLSVSLLLMLAGPLTVVPLLLFAIAARRLTLTVRSPDHGTPRVLRLHLGGRRDLQHRRLLPADKKAPADSICGGLITGTVKPFLTSRLCVPALP